MQIQGCIRFGVLFLDGLCLYPLLFAARELKETNGQTPLPSPKTTYLFVIPFPLFYWYLAHGDHNWNIETN